MAIQSVTNNSNKVNLSSKSTQSETVKKADTQATEKRTDEIDITAVAKEITNAFKSGNTKSPIDHQRVNAVKLALEGNTYQIDAEKIAEKMMQLEKNPFPDSR
ncbi:MAG: flagellar biosynthesis anti-sigma factor FlgM [Methylococcaceae bacterium]